MREATSSTIFQMIKDGRSFLSFYYREIRTEDEVCQMLRIYEQWAEALAVKNRCVLDVGSGCGLFLLCCAKAGCGVSLGLDVSNRQTEAALHIMHEFGVSDRVHIERDDFKQRNFGEDKFDVITFNESLSHLGDVEGTLRKAASLLSSKGALGISDGNNLLFPPSLVRSLVTYLRGEFGPVEKELGLRGRPEDRQCFRDARKAIAMSLGANEKQAERIAARTMGLYGGDLQRFVVEYLAGKGPQVRRSGGRFRNPYTGEYPELPLNPLSLMRLLRGLGLRTRIMPPSFYFAKKHPWKNLLKRFLQAARLPDPFYLFLKPALYIIGQKDSHL